MKAVEIYTDLLIGHDWAILYSVVLKVLYFINKLKSFISSPMLIM